MAKMQVSYRNQPRVITSTRSEFISLQNTHDDERPNHDPLGIDRLISKGNNSKPTVDVGTFRWFHSRSPGEENHRIVVENELQWEDCYADLMDAMGEFHVVGFDLEGVALTNYKRAMRYERQEFVQLPPVVHDNVQAERPVLMQIATLSGFVLIIQIGHFQKIPVTLQQFLADETIIKVGVNIQSDAFWVSERWGTPVVGWVDLRSIVKEAEMRVPKEVRLKGRLGLKQLAQIFFGELRVTAECMKIVSYSNWAKRNLTPIQLYYATFDAQIGVDICGVVLMKLNKGISFTADGKSIMNCPDKRYLISLEKNLHIGYSRQEVPMQALKLEDVISPNSSMDEKSFQFRNYMFSVCEGLMENADAECPGLERAIRHQIRKDEGRVPKPIRNETAQYSKPGYTTYVVSKLREDRMKLLPSRSDGRHPPTYWFQIPKISGDVGSRPRNRYSVTWLSDALYWKDMEWCMELEVVKLVRRRLEYDSGDRTSNIEMPPGSTLPGDEFEKGASVSAGAQISEEIEDGSQRNTSSLSHDTTEPTQGGGSGREKLLEEEDDGFAYHNHSQGDGDDADTELFFDSIEEEDEENYNPEDKGCVREAISLRPCWICGHRVVETLVWEPVVPESYLALYSHFTDTRCLCNWARLCISCCFEWRSNQYMTMLELAGSVGTSLDEPAYVAEYTERQAKEILTQLKAWEREKTAGKLVSLKDKQEMISALQRLSGISVVDVKEMEDLVDTNWYRLSKRRFHERDVLEKFEWNVIEVEKIFRIRLREMCLVTDFFYLPLEFTVEHECRKERDWSPPTSMTKDEIATALSKPGFHCDLDAAMDGAAGGLDDEANAHPNLRPTPSVSDNKSEKQFVAEADRKNKKKKKGRKDPFLAQKYPNHGSEIGVAHYDSSWRPKVASALDNDSSKTPQTFSNNSETFINQSMPWTNEVTQMTKEPKLVEKPKGHVAGRYSMHQYADPFVTPRGLISPKVDVHSWKQGSDSSFGATDPPRNHTVTDWKKDTCFAGARSAGISFGTVPGFQVNQKLWNDDLPLNRQYQTPPWNHNTSGRNEVHTFGSPLSRGASPPISLKHSNAHNHETSSGHQLQAVPQQKSTDLIQKESSSQWQQRRLPIGPPAKTLVFTSATKSTWQAPRVSPRIPGPRGSPGQPREIPRDFRSGKTDSSSFMRGEETVDSSPPASNLNSRRSERSFAPAPFPQTNQSRLPFYEPGPPPYPMPSQPTSVQVANQITQPSKWGGGSHVVSYGLPLHATITPTNYDPSIIDFRQHEVADKSSVQNTYRGVSQSADRNDNNIVPRTQSRSTVSHSQFIRSGPEMKPVSNQSEGTRQASSTFLNGPSQTRFSSQFVDCSNACSTASSEHSFSSTTYRQKKGAIRYRGRPAYERPPRFQSTIGPSSSTSKDREGRASLTEENERTERIGIDRTGSSPIACEFPNSPTGIPVADSVRHDSHTQHSKTITGNRWNSRGRGTPSQPVSPTYSASRTFTASQGSRGNKWTPMSYPAQESKSTYVRER